MKYLLAGVLVYNDEDGSLSLTTTPDEESEVLTCTANTLLKILLNHHGNVVERETLLREAWDARGLQGSNNSLNQYISILRKILAALVPDTAFIVTVPKTGFMITPELPVKTLKDLHPSQPSRRRHVYRFKRVYCILLTLLVIAMCSGFWVKKKSLPMPQMFLLTHMGECPVYSFSPLPDVFRARAMELAQSIQRDNTLPCLRHSVFYLHIQDSLFYSDEGKLLLSQCSLSGGKASACRTLYRSEW